MANKLFETMVGKTLTAVEGEVGGEHIRLICADGGRYRLYHSQDCCESVTVEDIVGDLSDLLGTPILSAREDRSESGPKGGWGDTETWTFYNLATVRGSVCIRWYGTSNGYYSEVVTVEYQDPDGRVSKETTWS